MLTQYMIVAVAELLIEKGILTDDELNLKLKQIINDNQGKPSIITPENQPKKIILKE